MRSNTLLHPEKFLDNQIKRLRTVLGELSFGRCKCSQALSLEDAFTWRYQAALVGSAFNNSIVLYPGIAHKKPPLVASTSGGWRRFSVTKLYM